MRLYRYRAFRPDLLKSEIASQQVYAWHLDEQNDPFEGGFVSDRSVSVEAIYSLFLQTREEVRKISSHKDKSWLHGTRSMQVDEAARFLASASDADLLSRAEAAFLNKYYENPALLQEIADKTKAMTHRALIACFSAVKDSPTMLAYYAAAHTGVCIEYEVAEGVTEPVDYVHRFPVLPLLAAERRSVVRVRLLTKHADWQHEREQRLIFYDRPPGLYAHPGIRVVGVAAGCRMSAKEKRELRALIDSMNDPAVEAWALVPRQDSYAFDRAPLDA